MRKLVKVLSVFLLLAALLCGFTSEAEAREVKRLFGASRVHTSLEISKEAYREAENVVLVGYKGEVDALTGSLLATSKDAPVLFVNEKYLKDVKQRLEDLKTKKVYILGGESVFSNELLKEFSAYNPTRIKGNNRFETAVKIAEASVGKTSNEVFLALGVGSHADALAIGPIAAKKQIPLLLTGKGKLPKETKNALKSMKVKKVNIIGGTGAISKTIENELKSLKIEIDRTSGNSRDLTAINIANKFNSNPKNIVIANGWNSADAVVGGYFVAKNNGVLLLANTSKIDPSVVSYIKSNSTDLFILGGTNAINSSVFNNVWESSGQATIVINDLKIVGSETADGNKTLLLKLDREIDISNANVKILDGDRSISISKQEIQNNGTSIRLNLSEKLKAGSYTISISGLTEKPIIGKITVKNQAEVSNEKELNQALKDSSIDTIKIMKDIKLKRTVSIERKVTIEGNNKVIDSPVLDDLDTIDGIYITGNNVVINNLTVQYANSSNVVFYWAKGGELNNVSLNKSYGEALLVYSSEVKVENLITKFNDHSHISVVSSPEYKSLSCKLTFVGKHIYDIKDSKGEVPFGFAAVVVYGRDLSVQKCIVGRDYIFEKQITNAADEYFALGFDKENYKKYQESLKR